MTGLFHRLFRLRPSRPRHPLARLALALVGILLAVLLLAGSVFIGLGMLAWHLATRLRRPAVPARPSGVIEGDYRVVEPRRLAQREPSTIR